MRAIFRLGQSRNTGPGVVRVEHETLGNWTLSPWHYSNNNGCVREVLLMLGVYGCQFNGAAP
jgi:hypothetical protein